MGKNSYSAPGQPFILGIDPAVGKGTSRIGMAVLSADGSSFVAGHSFRIADSVSVPYAVESISMVLPLVNPNQDECRVLVVEGQKVYNKANPRARTVSPQSIVFLAQMAGALLGLGTVLLKPKRIVLPTPGEVSKLDKETRHRQALHKLDCSVAYIAEATTHWVVQRSRSRPIIEEAPPLNEFPLDVLDAVCLARYGASSRAMETEGGL